MVNVAVSWETGVARAVGVDGICLGVLPCIVARLLIGGRAIVETLSFEKGAIEALANERVMRAMFELSRVSSDKKDVCYIIVARSIPRGFPKVVWKAVSLCERA